MLNYQRVLNRIHIHDFLYIYIYICMYIYIIIVNYSTDEYYVMWDIDIWSSHPTKIPFSKAWFLGAPRDYFFGGMNINRNEKMKWEQVHGELWPIAALISLQFHDIMIRMFSFSRRHYIDPREAANICFQMHLTLVLIVRIEWWSVTVTMPKWHFWKQEGKVQILDMLRKNTNCIFLRFDWKHVLIVSPLLVRSTRCIRYYLRLILPSPIG